MKIVFHGSNSAAFAVGIEGLLPKSHSLLLLPDKLQGAEQEGHYATAEVIVSSRLDSTLPPPAAVRLFHVPGAGVDGIDRSRLPAGTPLCNCFGHEVAIGEYVFAALLRRTVPAERGDRELRKGEWVYWSAREGSLHGELAGRTLGLVGFGHIGRQLARLGRAFGMRVVVSNRNPVETGPELAAYYPLERLPEMCAEADFVVCSLPHLPVTEGIFGRRAFAAMRPDAVIVNVGRGPVVDEQALFEALKERRIGGAVIDTWYVYPPAGTSSGVLPGRLPFHTLDNIVMTPHMSGWTDGMVVRRRQTIADNIQRLEQGRPLVNLVGG